MQSVSVKTASPYVVKIGPRLLEQTGAEVKQSFRRKICVVTDDTVKALCPNGEVAGSGRFPSVFTLFLPASV